MDSACSWIFCTNVRTTTEHRHWPPPLSTAIENRHWAPTLSTATEHRHWEPPLSTDTEHRHWAPPLRTATENRYWAPPLSTATKQFMTVVSIIIPSPRHRVRTTPCPPPQKKKKKKQTLQTSSINHSPLLREKNNKNNPITGTRQEWKWKVIILIRYVFKCLKMAGPFRAA